MTPAWRYECPEGHVTILRKHGNADRGGKPEHPYYCRTCSQGYDRVWDKKKDEWVTAR